MESYKIYAGLTGGFNNVHYQYTDEFESEDAAMDAAWIAAMEEYESYEGSYGLQSWNDCYEELLADYPDLNPDENEEDYDIVQNYYLSFVESWVGYYVKLVVEGDEDDE